MTLGINTKQNKQPKTTNKNVADKNSNSHDFFVVFSFITVFIISPYVPGAMIYRQIVVKPSRMTLMEIKSLEIELGYLF